MHAELNKLVKIFDFDGLESMNDKDVQLTLNLMMNFIGKLVVFGHIALKKNEGLSCRDLEFMCLKYISFLPTFFDQYIETLKDGKEGAIQIESVTLN